MPGWVHMAWVVAAEGCNLMGDLPWRPFKCLSRHPAAASTCLLLHKQVCRLC